MRPGIQRIKSIARLRKGMVILLIALLVVLLTACNPSQAPAFPAPVTLVIHNSPVEATATSRPITALILPTEDQVTPSPAKFDLISATGTAAGQAPPQAITATEAAPSPTAEPSMTSDLLFISGSRLMRWDHVTNYTTTLAENVIDYSADATGERLALLRSRRISANGVQLYNLDILDLKTKQMYTLVQNSPPLYQMSISPDGSRIAHLAGDGMGQVFVQSAGKAATPVKMGECHPANELHCQDLLWSPDSRSLAWSDKDGAWLSSTRDNRAKLVLSSQVNILDPESNQQLVSVSFANLQWSPTGRFLLSQVIPSPEGVRWFGVIDTLDGRMVNLPDSSQFARPCLGALWLADGSLLVTHGGMARSSVPATAKIWRVVPTRNDLLVLAGSAQLQTGSLPVSSSTTYEMDYCIYQLNQLAAGSYLALVEVMGSTANPVLCSLDLKEGELRKTTGLPADTSSLLWSPDGYGALAFTRSGKIFFIDSLTGKTLDLSDEFGSEVRRFYWLTPMPRS